MTIINGIEIDIGKIAKDDTKAAIDNNEPVESKLHVIVVLSNPCQFARRYILAREFIQRMAYENDIVVYVVELAYGDQQFYVTEKGNRRHLQLRAAVPLWHKENMVNLGVKLLPKTWRAMAWIDADIEFESTTWASDALKLLNGSRDIVQLFSHAIDMDRSRAAMSIFPSWGFQYSKNSRYGGGGINMWHPGYAWAITRRAYERMGGLYEVSILGSGDHNMTFSFIGNGLKSVNEAVTDDYKESIAEFEAKVRNFRLGYVPGVIRHYYHGSKKNRGYMERWKLLVDHAYEPSKFVTKNADGLLVPTAACPQGLLDDIGRYFAERCEDD
jgi:hypothetical protein